MADTIRTTAALIALLTDNTTGDISPQDMRDLLVSVHGVYGGIVTQGGSTAQTIVSGVPEPLENFTANTPASGTTPAFATDQITIDNAGVYEIAFQISFAGITNCVFNWRLAIDAVVGNIGCDRKTSNTDVGSASFVCQVTLAAAEVLTMSVEGDQNGNFTMTESQFQVKRIG